jgi:hypothetical protein
VTGETTQGNYTLTFEDATMTVAPADAVIVKITANNGSYLYDGTEKDLSGYTVEISNPLYTEADFTFTGNSDLKAAHTGIYQTGMKAADFANINDNFADVIFEVTNGTLEITKRDVILTSGSATKAYDGTALTSNAIETSGDGFVDGEGVNITWTGRQTGIGTSENSFAYTFEAGTRAADYNVTTTFGTLTVTGTESHRLTINYLGENGELIKQFTREYAVGETYSVTTERISGYEADTEKVTGTMGTEDITLDVHYTLVNYTLTISFTSTRDGSQVMDPIELELKSGETYSVIVPEIEGFTPLVTEITGKMPASNRTVTVFMIPDGDEFRRDMTPIIIDDYGTALGAFNSNLGSGEIIE